jgi:hypothetical protein
VGAASSRDQFTNNDGRIAAGSRSHNLRVYCMNLSKEHKLMSYAQQCLPVGHALPALSNDNFSAIFR